MYTIRQWITARPSGIEVIAFATLGAMVGDKRISPETTLQQEIAALEHELRRVRDGLERNRSRELEIRARQLRDNIELCRRDLEAEFRTRPVDG